MAFRLPSQKKFKPNVNKTVARKASIPASLAKPSGSSTTSTPNSSSTPQALSAPRPTPSPLAATPALEDDGLPPGLGSSESTLGPPTIGSSAPIQTPGTFREPSLPPSRKRGASPTPSNASKSSRTGGRPTLIHLAASTGPARRPTASPSPAPVPATQSQVDARPTASLSPAPMTQSQDSARPAPPPSPASAPAPAPVNQSQTDGTRTTASPAPAASNQNQNQTDEIRPTPSPAPPTASQSMAPPSTKTQTQRRPLAKPVPFPPRTPLPKTTPTPAPAPAPARTSPSPSPSQSYSQPPTIGSSQDQMPPGGQGTQSSQSSLIDPQLLDDTQTPGAGPSRSPQPPARPLSTAEMAMQLVAGIASLPAPVQKPKPKLRKDGKPRKAYTRTNPHNKKRGTRDPSQASGTDDGEASSRASATPGAGESENGSERGTTPATTKKTAEPRPRRKIKQKTPEYDEDGNVIRKVRGPYKSRGRANTEHDRRLSKFRKARSTSGVPASTNGDGGGEGEEVDPFAEDIPIDPELLKMGSFASNFYDGDMTERAVLLKTAQKNKQEESRKERLEFERMKRIRLQPLRRRERAKRNEDRAQRRVLWEEDGAPEGDEEVSDDEMDSTDEEYDFEPDHLTPPGSPDPNQYNDQNGEDEEEEGIRPDEARPEDEDEEDQEGLGLDVNAYDNGEGEDYDEEVMPQTNLADWGFNVTDDPDPDNADQGLGQVSGDPNEPEPDYSNLYDINPGEEGEYGEDGEDGGPNFSFADYSANMESRRTQALATQNSRFVVQEDDDETRMINSVSWQKRERTDKWTDDETDFFYSVLGEVGENYSMMKAFFPGRTVAQIKKKGVRENAKNPEKVTAAINARRPIDNGYLMKSAGYDPDRPWDKEEALFAEAKRDMARIKAEDQGMVFDENGEMVGEADEGSQMGDGDVTMDMDLDPIDEVLEEEEEGEGQGQEGEGAEEEAGEAGAGDEAQAEGEDGGEEEQGDAGNESLFLPGATSP